MPNIFVFTAGDQDAKAHLDVPVEDPVDREEVFKTFEDEYHEHRDNIARS